MKAMHKSRRQMILLTVTALVVVLGGVQTAALIIGFKDAREQTLSNTKSIAVSVAHTLSLNPEAYRELSRTKDVESPYYKEMCAYMRAIKEEIGNIMFITTENKLDDKTTEFILDAEEPGSGYYAKPGEHNVNHERKDPVFTTGVARSYKSKKGVTAGKWGDMLAGYAPILAADGEVLGVVGVDVRSSYVWKQFTMTLITLMIANLTIAVLVLASVFGFSGRILDRMFRDKLTGAFTKRHFDTLLSDGIARCIRYKQGLALMMLDLDHFKRVNDTYGHPFGDKVLATFSEVIRNSIRPEDSFIRYGGEEFALIVASAGAKSAMDVAERLRQAVEARPIFNEERNAVVNVTVSIGVARLVNLSQTPRELVENADKALYAAKVTRNAVKLHE